jgi:hypothetical protein
VVSVVVWAEVGPVMRSSSFIRPVVPPVLALVVPPVS